ncbi:MAG: hypothetical protein KDA76_07690 [Planctomycetaceae bacterium]|nr:hypothetical protein [Planctomycetaceae bacterium]
MKRIAATLVICCYLGALGWGVFAHTLSVGNASHPVMYYLVWDMFCGWSGYETRHHIVAEGESGAHYLLNPAPWGEFRPYGSAHRPDYDNFAVHSVNIARNVLARTEHEPIQRIYVVEENWSKRYNRPEFLWKLEFEEEMQPHSYFHVRVTYDGDGNLLERKHNWTTAMYQQDVMQDSRMVRLRQQARPFLAVTPGTAQPANTPFIPFATAVPNNGAIQQTAFEFPIQQ